MSIEEVLGEAAEDDSDGAAQGSLEEAQGSRERAPHEAADGAFSGHRGPGTAYPGEVAPCQAAGIYIGKRPGAARQEADGRGGLLPRTTQTLENSRSLSLPARPLAEDEGLASVIQWNPALQEPLDTEADEEEFHDRKSLQLQFALSRDETQDEAAAVAKAPFLKAHSTPSVTSLLNRFSVVG